jgi:hypothetical protein
MTNVIVGTVASVQQLFKLAHDLIDPERPGV